jgi:cytochrome c oxidase subunit IV
MGHDAHGHGHGEGGDHVPHVLPLSIYFKTFGALMVLTVLTVAASYVHISASINLAIALLIATAKAAVVALIFMHLFWDHKFHSVIFASSIIFLAIFIGFTMSDTEGRGRADAIAGERPAEITAPFVMTKSEMRMQRKLEERKAALPAPAPTPPAPAPAPAPTEEAPAGEEAPAEEAAAAPAVEPVETPPEPAGEPAPAPPAP